MKHQECKRLDHVPLEFTPIWEPLVWHNTIFLFHFLQHIALYYTKESLLNSVYMSRWFLLETFCQGKSLTSHDHCWVPIGRHRKHTASKWHCKKNKHAKNPSDCFCNCKSGTDARKNVLSAWQEILWFCCN